MFRRFLPLLLAAAAVLGLGVWIGSRDEAPAAQQGEQATNLTVRSATPDDNELGSACKLLPLADVRKFMKAPDMESVDPNTIYTGDTANCIYRNTGNTAVGVIAYNQNADMFTSSRIQLAKLYEQNKNQKAYKRAFVSNMSTVNTVPDTQTFYVHSAKYGHDLMFVNNGHVTVRLRITPFDLNRGSDLIVITGEHMAGIRSITDLNELEE